MKIIHTSDWHLGQEFYSYDRNEEHNAFLLQLRDRPNNAILIKIITFNSEITIMQIVSSIFRKVADALHRGASAIGITYNEINIIVYYLLIPLTWTIMLDYWLSCPITTYALIFIWFDIKIGTWGRFREWSNWAFMRSVDFLNYFNRWGGNYVFNSVIICVLVPILIYVGLFLLLILK